METFKDPIIKDLTYVKSKNWAREESMFKRCNDEKRQRLITERHLTKLKHFAKITEDYREYKTVTSLLNTLVEFKDIYVDRFKICEEEYDWTEYETKYSYLEEEELQSKIDEEIEFQSEVLKYVAKFRQDVQSLNLNNNNEGLEIPIFADIPAPFLLRDKLERLYPKIKKYRDAKRQKK